MARWLAFVSLFAIACTPSENADPVEKSDAGFGDATAGDAGTGGRIVDDRRAYADDSLEVLEIVITTDDLPGLERVMNDEPSASVTVHFTEGAFGPGTSPNAVMDLRGASTRYTEQKSFKIKLDSATELWRGQRVINLNKHPYDLTRARNKLAFDLFEEIEDFTSLRTQFVTLTVNGQAMGLFTQIEQPNRLFLERHGLDPDGWLYKANNFTFFPIPDAVALDAPALEEIIEPKGTSDHSKLQAMLLELGDPSIDIDEIIERHFERNNYETWLAVNLLLGNWDTISQNFYLYSPTGSLRWYFLPWDYDGALGFDEQPGNPARPRWQAGFATWWEVPLHRRFLSKRDNRRRVEERMEALRVALAPRAEALLSSYHALLLADVTTDPDVGWLPILPPADDLTEKIRQFEAESQRLSMQLDRNAREYQDVQDRPMPVWLGEPIPDQQGGFELYWDPSFDLQGDALTYDFAIGTSPDVEASVLQRQNMVTAAPVALNGLAPGIYYVSLVIRDARNPAQHWQIPFDIHWDPIADQLYPGVKEITIP